MLNTIAQSSQNEQFQSDRAELDIFPKLLHQKTSADIRRRPDPSSVWEFQTNPDFSSGSADIGRVFNHFQLGMPVIPPILVRSLGSDAEFARSNASCTC